MAKIHGLTYHPLNRIYRHIKDRCYNPNNDSFKNYGAKGIKMCPRWFNDFLAFYNWAIKNGYSKTLTIDRKKTSGNYSPVNCRWVDRKVQGNNRSTNRILTANGKAMTMQQWSEQTGIKYSTIKLRLRRGWSEEKALTEPIKIRGENKDAVSKFLF